ncbi:MAG: hypothetical protein Q8L56_13415 [Rhodocyclaceae bacterium]|nr:hypothetical protein [Rhodocyclaceae bacterium]
MTVSIPSFSIRIREDGELESDPITLHVRFDVCPTWVQIAKRHLDSALAAKANRDMVWQGTDEDAKAQALEVEFEASMQAIMAAAIAWDAAYAVLREHVTIPPTTLETWRKGRTARYTQVAEVVRRAFTLKPKGAAMLRANLKELYRYRDLAVHPSGKIEAPMLHPELNLGMEWRFIYFRAMNAELAVMAAAAMLWDLAYNGKSKDPKVSEYQKTLATRLSEIFPAGAPVVPLALDAK